MPEHETATIIITGAGTSLFVDELLAHGVRLVLNDISDETRRKLEQRMGNRAFAPVWLHHDIVQPLPLGVQACDL